MNTLVEAMNDQALTENGAFTNNSSLSKNVDLFFLAGASRGKDLTALFRQAHAENSDLAVRIMQWARDARSGAGERQLFRDLLKDLIEVDVDLARRILTKTPELGRWDDVLVVLDTVLEAQAVDMIRTALTNGMEAKSLLEKLDDMTEEECAVMLEKMSND